MQSYYDEMFQLRNLKQECDHEDKMVLPTNECVSTAISPTSACNEILKTSTPSAPIQAEHVKLARNINDGYSCLQSVTPIYSECVTTVSESNHHILSMTKRVIIAIILATILIMVIVFVACFFPLL